METYLRFLLFISISLFFGCKKNKPAINQLPPETQTGAGTFGCLVNGGVFKPKGSPFGGSIKSCAYQRINDGYYFQLSAKNSGDILTSVSIHTDSLPIEENKIYILENFFEKQTASGRYFISNNSNMTFTEYLTTSSITGELKITKFDETQRIVSGTFWFDAVNDKGEKVQVREGRFDMNYTL